jgi:hypothetical protein
LLNPIMHPNRRSLSEIDRLRKAASSGDLTSVKAFFAQWRSIPASEKWEVACFRGALFDAVRNNHHGVTSYLLSMGVPPNMDVVVLATQSKSCTALQLLLDHGWNINEPVLRMDRPPPLMSIYLILPTLWRC